MLETRAIVMQLDGQDALVQANQGNGCSQCQGKGCGSGKVAQMFCNKPRHFRVNNAINARVGEEVIVSVADGAVYQGIGLVYGLPLLLLVVGVGIGLMLANTPTQRDGYAALGALCGLLIGFLAAKKLAAQSKQNVPFITKRCS